MLRALIRKKEFLCAQRRKTGEFAAADEKGEAPADIDEEKVVSSERVVKII